MAAPVAAQIADDMVKIDFIADIRGPPTDIDDAGGSEAFKMTIADLGGNGKGDKIEFA